MKAGDTAVFRKMKAYDSSLTARQDDHGMIHVEAKGKSGESYPVVQDTQLTNAHVESLRNRDRGRVGLRESPETVRRRSRRESKLTADQEAIATEAFQTVGRARVAFGSTPAFRRGWEAAFGGN